MGRVSARDKGGKRFKVPGGQTLTPYNRQTINSMGLGDYADQMISPAQQQPHMFGGQPGQQPAATTSNAPAAPPASKDRSIAAAMALPVNSGKRKAEGEADIKKYGYNAVP